MLTSRDNWLNSCKQEKRWVKMHHECMKVLLGLALSSTHNVTASKIFSFGYILDLYSMDRSHLELYPAAQVRDSKVPVVQLNPLSLCFTDYRDLLHFFPTANGRYITMPSWLSILAPGSLFCTWGSLFLPDRLALSKVCRCCLVTQGGKCWAISGKLFYNPLSGNIFSRNCRS